MCRICCHPVTRIRWRILRDQLDRIPPQLKGTIFGGEAWFLSGWVSAPLISRESVVVHLGTLSRRSGYSSGPSGAFTHEPTFTLAEYAAGIGPGCVKTQKRPAE